MIDSRGGVTGGATIADFIRDFEQQGFTSEFSVRPGGRLRCSSCGRRVRAGDVSVHSLRRVEGVSDPADQSLIGALECPECGSLGTATFCHGAHCPPEDGEVLRQLHDVRPSTAATAGALPHDESLVRDTGWLRGPDD
jgi:hypothetical protein